MKHFITFIVLNLLDCITTFIGIRYGLAEANILLASLFKHSIWLGLGVKMLLALAIGFLVFKKRINLFKPLNIAFIIIVLLNVLSLSIM